MKKSQIVKTQKLLELYNLDTAPKLKIIQKEDQAKQIQIQSNIPRSKIRQNQSFKLINPNSLLTNNIESKDLLKYYGLRENPDDHCSYYKNQLKTSVHSVHEAYKKWRIQCNGEELLYFNDILINQNLL